jgi:hypothetical protein
VNGHGILGGSFCDSLVVLLNAYIARTWYAYSLCLARACTKGFGWFNGRKCVWVGVGVGLGLGVGGWVGGSV